MTHTASLQQQLLFTVTLQRARCVGIDDIAVISKTFGHTELTGHVLNVYFLQQGFLELRLEIISGRAPHALYENGLAVLVYGIVRKGIHSDVFGRNLVKGECA